MKSKQTTVYLHFRNAMNIPALHNSFPDTAFFVPIMENSCLISSYLTYKSVLDLMERDFPNDEYFICVAGRHYVVAPASAAPSMCASGASSYQPTRPRTVEQSFPGSDK